ncbi:MAG: choice-of-anchor B family protein [Saprospiraceae bacterium]
MGAFLSAANAQNSHPRLKLIGHLPYAPATLAGCMGYVDSAGAEYALVGASTGLSIVDLSDPSQPFERFHVPMPPNNWRELRAWAGFLYVGTEASGAGIFIVDLRALPDTVIWKQWFGDDEHADQVQRSHTVQTADGRLYIFGSGGPSNGGALICSLDDPWNPKIEGIYSANYVHDGHIRGDTLWASEIYAGQFAVIDISDCANPQVLATRETPGRFNHNSELSPDGRVLFTTDEVINAPLAAFDVTQIDDIPLLDLYYPGIDPSRMVHNVRVKGLHLVCPSYGGQLSLVDASEPDNLVETAIVKVGASLVWDADPYLPSGIVFATAKNEGLFVFQPIYSAGAKVAGTVRDAATGDPVAGAAVRLSGAITAKYSRQDGLYKTGAPQAGAYDLWFSAAGYDTLLVQDFALAEGQTAVLDVWLTPVSVAAPDRLPSASAYRLNPNPASDALWISGGEKGQRVWARVADAQGRVVLSAPMDPPALLPLPRTLLPGPYRLQIADGAGRVHILPFVKI